RAAAPGLRFEHAARRMERCLQEFRIRGVKTNIPFLVNLVLHPAFLAGGVTTSFLDETPELLDLPQRKDRATKILSYLGEVIVNGNPETRGQGSGVRGQPAVPDAQGNIPEGTRDRLKVLGAEKFAKWVREQKRLLVTDTTMR